MDRLWPRGLREVHAALTLLAEGDRAEPGTARAVSTTMTKDVTYCRPGDLLHDVWTIMKERSLLHVPIVGEDSKPLGVINALDALLSLLEGSEYQEALLRDYVMGIGYR